MPMAVMNPIYAYLVRSSANLDGTVVLAYSVVGATSVYTAIYAGSQPPAGLNYTPVSVECLGDTGGIGNSCTSQTSTSATLGIC